MNHFIYNLNLLTENKSFLFLSHHATVGVVKRVVSFKWFVSLGWTCWHLTQVAGQVLVQLCECRQQIWQSAARLKTTRCVLIFPVPEMHTDEFNWFYVVWWTVVIRPPVFTAENVFSAGFHWKISAFLNEDWCRQSNYIWINVIPHWNSSILYV